MNQQELNEWKQYDIGKSVVVFIEGIKYEDTIVKVCLPDGQIIIGPSLKCAQIFARFTMLPDMMRVSDMMIERMNKLE